jgi:GST-like protein
LPRAGLKAREFAGIDFDRSPNIARWYEMVAARPAVQAGIAKVTGLVPAT